MPADRLRLRRAAATALAACAIATSTGSLSAASGAAGAGPTGSAAAIALFESAAATTNAQPAIDLEQSGYMTMRTSISPTSFAYRFGYGTVPSGYVRADESITYAQHDGKVLWVKDVLTPNTGSCAATPSCNPSSSLELFVTKKAAFAGDVDESKGGVGCYERERFSDVPYRAGVAWFTPVGDFRGMAKHGNQALLTVVYVWPDGQRVTEHDSIDLKAMLFSASSIHVARGPLPTEVAFGIYQLDTALTTSPHAPKVTLCS